MKTFFAFTTGLLAGFVGTVSFLTILADGNGKYKEFVDAITSVD